MMIRSSSFCFQRVLVIQRSGGGRATSDAVAVGAAKHFPHYHRNNLPRSFHTVTARRSNQQQQQKQQRSLLLPYSSRPCRSSSGLLLLRRVLSTSSAPRKVTIGSTKSSSSSSSSNTGSNSGKKGFNWKRFAWYVRAMRIPFIVLSVYTLGYQQGVMDCTKHPERLAEEILHSILLSVGVQSMDKQVLILPESEISILNRSRPHQVALVGHRIVSAARDYVQQELQKAMQQVAQSLPADLTPEQAMQEYMRHDEVQFWYNAALRLLGEGQQVPIPGSSNTTKQEQGYFVTAASSWPRKEWQYIFIDSHIPNAFVTEILPQRFFITTAMLEVATTPDELAMVLGHEVSHLILGHVSESNQVETMLRTLEVLLLSLDPTEGIIALGVISLIATMRKALSAAHSRESERQADDLGIVLAARACFDTKSGVEVMRKMASLSISPATIKPGATASTSPVPTSSPPSPSSEVVMTGLLDTHPPSMERYRVLQEKSKTENSTKYNDQCATISQRFYAAIWGPDGDDSGEEDKDRGKWRKRPQ